MTDTANRPKLSLFDRLFPAAAPAELGDFTTTRRVLPIALVAIVIGVLSGFVALALLKLIALFTNAFFFQTLDTLPRSLDAHPLGGWFILVPTGGALLIGLIARYGSDRIRGHGIPEALESILMRGSRVEPRLAVLKPLSAAISIGSGGPFGAEGPIIMTGGAFGSLIAQGFHLTSAERKTLLVAGAAGGMTATFGSPLAAMLLAVELLLFELKPRSLVPVALSCAAALATRQRLLPVGALFHVPHHAAVFGPTVLLGCVVAGLAAGVLATLLTASIYFWEDFFHLRLKKLHWMWWPALAGLAIGLGGVLCPRALGVGYDSIADLLGGRLDEAATVRLLLVKWAIWSFALGSGTSGGVLAPLLMLGASLGLVEQRILPDVGAGFWPLVSMGAVLGGTMRAPFTGILFALEVTHDWDAALPLALAVTLAHLTTVLVLRRSILTEKVARRGYHVTCEYAIDPLEVLFVREAMGSAPAARPSPGMGTAYPDETLRSATHRMAEARTTALAVVAREAPDTAVGEITLEHMLVARRRHLEEETRRERVLPIAAVLAPWRFLRGLSPK
jgi:chloride channel protein, CIC family